MSLCNNSEGTMNNTIVAVSEVSLCKVLDLCITESACYDIR